MACELISVGIDVGTTTTQLVFSKLTVAERGAFMEKPQARYAPARKPRADVGDKEVIYESNIYITPYHEGQNGNRVIDVEALEYILETEYKNAGFAPAEVETGAVIITGESVKAENAQKVLDLIAPLAGDFVVTVAGPSLEAHLAGRGSGAAAWSGRHFTWAANLDIGGGTTNIAIFYNNDLMDVAVLQCGGRHIEVDHETMRIRKITKPGQRMLDHLGIKLAVGDPADLSTLRRFAELMADLIVEVISGKPSPLCLELLQTAPLKKAVSDRPIFISGGVSDFYYIEYPIKTLDDMAVYDDVGPLLGQALRNHPYLSTLHVEKPDETVRATVMGASHETITVSGMTIWVSPDKLPMRNIPVLRPQVHGEKPAPPELSDAVLDACERWDLNPAKNRIAIAMDMYGVDRYEELCAVADAVADFAREYVPPTLPVILVMERDLGKALGQAVKARVPDHDVLSIDEIWLGEGDYIDIGRSLLGDRLVSLSVKTLIFPS